MGMHDAAAQATAHQRQVAALQAQQQAQQQQQAHMQQLLRSLTPVQQQQISMLAPPQQVWQMAADMGWGLMLLLTAAGLSLSGSGNSADLWWSGLSTCVQGQVLPVEWQCAASEWSYLVAFQASASRSCLQDHPMQS